MTIPPISEPYTTTVGAIAAILPRAATAAAVDLSKVARIVLEVAAMNEWPQRLLFGFDAVTYARDGGVPLSS